MRETKSPALQAWILKRAQIQSKAKQMVTNKGTAMLKGIRAACQSLQEHLSRGTACAKVLWLEWA